MKSGRFWAWVTFGVGIGYFFIPLIATFEFSLRMRRGVYSFDAYRVVFGDERFQATFTYSVVVAIFTIILGVLVVVPTAYWIRLRMPHLRPIVEFITLLPLVIPAIVIVFGYIRMYGSNSPLPFLATARGTDVLLVIGYATLALPYMYRAVDTGLRTIDVRTLTEAAQILGAGWTTIIARRQGACPGQQPRERRAAAVADAECAQPGHRPALGIAHAVECRPSWLGSHRAPRTPSRRGAGCRR